MEFEQYGEYLYTLWLKNILTYNEYYRAVNRLNKMAEEKSK